FVLSLVGGLIGALLLLWTPTSIFASLVPWLILFATIVFAVGNFTPVHAIRRIQLGPRSALAVLFIILIYGGYFGRGHRFPHAGRVYAVRHARHQRDERPQDGAGGRDDDHGDHRIHGGKRGALAGDATDVRKLGGRLLHGRALGAAARSTADQGLRYRARSHADHLFRLARRLSEARSRGRVDPLMRNEIRLNRHARA